MCSSDSSPVFGQLRARVDTFCPALLFLQLFLFARQPLGELLHFLGYQCHLFWRLAGKIFAKVALLIATQRLTSGAVPADTRIIDNDSGQGAQTSLLPPHYKPDQITGRCRCNDYGD